MKSRLISLMRKPSAAGFTLGDLFVVLIVAILVAAILYPVVTRP